jgi:Tol biopolymer transport system component
MDLYVVAADGAELRRVTDGNARYRSQQWSPDGRSIAVHSDRGGSYQVWLVDPDGAQYTKVTQSGGAKIYPFWAPDGSRLGFVELGRAVALVQPAAGSSSAETLLRGDLMVRPQWSPDGRWIAGVLPPSAGGSGIVVYSLATRTPVTVSTFGDAPQWLPDSRRLVFAWQNSLYLGDMATQQVRKIFSFERDRIGLGSVSRDGRWIYLSRTVTEADLWSIEWRR